MNEYMWAAVVIAILVILYFLRQWVPFINVLFNVMVFGSLVWSITTLAYLRYKGWL